MLELKLQIGCLLVILYYIVLYLRDTVGKNAFSCHPLFDAIICIAPWSIIFDGLTAYTVNHMDTVPKHFNVVFHGIFFVLEEVLVLLLFSYFMDMLFGKKFRRKIKLFLLPGAAAILVTIGFLGQVSFIEGEKTNYSMGVSVYACFITVILYFASLGVVIFLSQKQIESGKRLNIIAYIVFSFITLAIQFLFPEVLISALLPAAALICIYENFESGSLRRLKMQNEEMVESFATLVENRDDNTGGHIKRTKEYVSIIIHQMQKKPEYSRILTRDYVHHIIDAAPMHDIGKISTPDSILQKPGKLDDEEYRIMKEHSAKGGEIINKTFAGINNPDFLKIAYEVARYHHEKWNGKGYPEGIEGENIPLHARIMAIADVFDAVSAKRCYRDAMPLDKCFRIIEEGRGTDFDPKLVDLFMSAKNEIIEYYEKQPAQ